jgi:hypothetical protein
MKIAFMRKALLMLVGFSPLLVFSQAQQVTVPLKPAVRISNNAHEQQEPGGEQKQFDVTVGYYAQVKDLLQKTPSLIKDLPQKDRRILVDYEAKFKNEEVFASAVNAELQTLQQREQKQADKAKKEVSPDKSREKLLLLLQALSDVGTVTSE